LSGRERRVFIARATAAFEAVLDGP